jgi:tetratricopeptide (TPR) repeat protein
MRINRSASRLSFRPRRRRSGCVSMMIMLGVVIGVGAMAWRLIERGWQPSSAAQPENPAAAAQRAFDTGDLDSAIALLRGSPADGRSALLLTRALIYRSFAEYDRAIDRESALQITTETTRRRPADLDALAAHALALQAVGRNADAADAAQRALDRSPTHVMARTALAMSYGGAGAHEAALREGLQAAQMATEREAVDVLRAVALSRGNLGEYGEAIRLLDQAIRYNPAILALYFERALYSRQLGDVDSATVAYFDVLARSPNNVKARLRLCELSSMMREREAALAYCGEVTQRAPSWSEGWYYLGREFFLQGDFESARDNLNRCASLQVLQNVPVSERRFECWYLQGQAAQILGDCASLISTYNEFRSMASSAAIQQTWSYPPEGPPGCALR